MGWVLVDQTYEYLATGSVSDCRLVNLNVHFREYSGEKEIAKHPPLFCKPLEKTLSESPARWLMQLRCRLHFVSMSVDRSQKKAAQVMLEEAGDFHDRIQHIASTAPVAHW